MPPNVLNYWKAEFLRDLSKDVIDVAVDAFGRVPSPMSSILFFPIRGAASRVAPDATAFPHRHGFHVGIYSLWRDRRGERSQHGLGATDVEGHAAFRLGRRVCQRARATMTAWIACRWRTGPNYDRLQQIKAKYDPQNVFSQNANIAPAPV